MDDIDRAKYAIDFISKNTFDIAVYLVVNLKTDQFVSCDIYDEQTEFFSEEELGELINALEDLNIYHEVSYGEKDFARKVMSGQIQLQKFKYKIVYNTTGGIGKRSKSAIVPAICELHGLNYASSDIFSSALLEHKAESFSLLSNRFNIPRFWIYDNINGWINDKPIKELKLIAKPAYGCASLGITEKNISYFTDDFEKMISYLSQKLAQPIIVQEFIQGWEVEVPVFDLGYPTILEPVGVQINQKDYFKDEILTYELVSEDQYSFYKFSLKKPNKANELKNIARRSFIFLSLRGTVRVDFRITKNGKCYITDYNNSPHFTQFHSCAKSAQFAGFSYADMISLCLYKGIYQFDSSNFSPNL